MSYVPTARVWCPDAIPPGLDASSYQRGDGTAGWSTTTDGSATIAQTAFGLQVTAVTNTPCIWKTLPAGELSITTQLSLIYTTNPPVSGFHVVGLDVGDMAGTFATADWYRVILEYNGIVNPAFQFQRWTNGAFSATLSTLAAVNYSLGDAYFRVGINADRTLVNVSVCQDGQGWRPFANVVPTLGILQAGIQGTPGGGHCPFYRVRVGAGESTQDNAEGYLVDTERYG